MTLTVSVAASARTWSRPVRNSRSAWSGRAGCIVTLESDFGVRGRGEAAPLPNFSSDTRQDCEQVLSTLDPSGIPDRMEPNQDLIGELGRASVRIPPHLPAARAALEAALLDLWARTAGLPAWALLARAVRAPQTPQTPPTRAVAALLSAEPEQVVTQAMTARARGIGTFKFKIGRAGAIEQELSAVRALRAELGPQARLRLDANQAFSLADARRYLPSFAACGLEFIEEPCPPAEIAQLADLALPLALDESLAAGARPRPGDRAVIAKPTLQGGITGTLALAALARAAGAELILSHAFEGPLGLGLSAALALSVGSETLAHGLDAEGAELSAQALPWSSGATLQAWSEVGFGLEEQP